VTLNPPVLLSPSLPRRGRHSPTRSPTRPKQGERFVGSLSAIKARAPVLGGNFGVWGGLFSSFDCAVKGYRQKEDPWNAIISGFLTGGSLALRGEWRVACTRLFSPNLRHRGRARISVNGTGHDGLVRVRTALCCGRGRLREPSPLTLTPAAGPRSALGSAVGCGILLGVFEGERVNHPPNCVPLYAYSG
jgi:hypothetical protein